jgi:hypothetical protein
MWRSVVMLRVNSGACFSLRVSPALAKIKTRKLKHAPLRNVLAAARAQIHARPSRWPEFHIQRRVKHLLQ